MNYDEVIPGAGAAAFVSGNSKRLWRGANVGGAKVL